MTTATEKEMIERREDIYILINALPVKMSRGQTVKYEAMIKELARIAQAIPA